MAKTIHQAQVNNAFNADDPATYTNVCGVNNGPNATESQVKMKFRTAGVFSDAGIYCSSNASDGTAVATLRVNGADSTLLATITTATTGLFQDATHSVTISAGDDINWKYTFNGTGAGGAIRLQNVFCAFAATGTTMKRLGSTGINITTAAVQYHSFCQNGGSGITTEANVKFLFRTAGTLKNGHINVFINSQTTTCTIRSRVNAANGNIAIAVTTLATGSFEDTSNTDTIASGDLVNFSFAGGDNVNSIVIRPCSFEFVTTNSKYPVICGNFNVTGTSIAAGTTAFLCIDGGISVQQSTEANANLAVPTQIDATNLWVDIVSNAGTTNGTLDLRVAGASSALTVSITALTTGTFEDSTHTVTVSSGALINLRIVTGATGATSFGTLGFLATGPSDSSIKTVNGLAKASVKTVNGLAIASVKTMKGLT